MKRIFVIISSLFIIGSFNSCSEASDVKEGFKDAEKELSEGGAKKVEEGFKDTEEDLTRDPGTELKEGTKEMEEDLENENISDVEEGVKDEVKREEQIHDNKNK